MRAGPVDWESTGQTSKYNNMGYEKKLEGSIELRVSCISTLISYTTEVNKKTLYISLIIPKGETKIISWRQSGQSKDIT